MRQTLVEHARRNNAGKRYGRCLKELARLNQRQARVL